MSTKKVIAVDLGASNGRLISVAPRDGRLEMKEIYRFPNEGIHIGERLYTDILRLYHEILAGLRKAVQEEGEIAAVAIDSWGVDFALLDENGEMLGNPYHYRDPQSAGMMEKADAVFQKGGLFRYTGVQDMWVNTVYQLMGIQERNPKLINTSDRFLMIPDILAYFLTGDMSTEYTSASTTQVYDVKKKQWSDEVCRGLGIKKEIFPDVRMTGELKGLLSPQVKTLIGLPAETEVKVIATAGHDSAAAAYAVPAEEEDYIFINSGTWSIIGRVIDEPIVTDEIFENEYSNEGAAFGRVKLVKTIMGMWLIQELRKSWERQKKPTDYGFLISEAEKAEAFSHLVNVDDELFTAPLDMEQAINEYCARTGQTAIHDQGALYRTVMESLAFKCREAVTDLERITGKKSDTIYLLGGAVQDQTFCRFIANATGKNVSAGPVEATAAGNALIQLKSLGILEDEKDKPDIIKKSFDIWYYRPEETEKWDQMYQKYTKIVKMRS